MCRFIKKRRVFGGGDPKVIQGCCNQSDRKKERGTRKGEREGKEKGGKEQRARLLPLRKGEPARRGRQWAMGQEGGTGNRRAQYNRSSVRRDEKGEEKEGGRKGVKMRR